MNRFHIGFAVALLAAGPAVAQTFKAENGVLVDPVANGFAVSGDAGIGAPGVWCGAADYARKHEGVRGNQRLYVAEGRKAGRGQPVVFTLDPAGLTPSTATILGSSLSRAGANLSVGHAYSFCADSRLSSGADR